ncbi:MAG: hypothetical protein U1F83_09845 [Verrucomicrobiota bacterium]|jgi:hypothetical protein
MSTKVARPDRSRRISAICLTVIVGLLAAAAVAGMIYFYYTTRRF